MKVYVAAPARMKRDALEYMALVRETGHEVTFDWATLKEEGGQGIIRPDWRSTPVEAREHASKEKAAVKEADVLIILTSPGGGGAGCFWEAGIASGVDGTIWVVYHQLWDRDCVFMYLPEAHFLSDIREVKAALEFARANEMDDPLIARREVAERYTS